MSEERKDEPKPVKAGSSDVIRGLAASLNARIFKGSAPKKNTSRISETSPFLGLRIYFEARDIESAERALEKAIELLEKERIKSSRLDWLAESLLFTARNYWTGHDLDRRVVFSEMKKKVKFLQRELDHVIQLLERLPSSTREALESEASSLFPKRSARDFVDELENVSTLIYRACGPISSRKNVTVRRSFRFEQCSADLWAVRERITKSKIAHTFDLVGGAFTTTDAAFIHAIMRAIDETVTASNVQGGLRRAAKAKSKRK